MEGEPPIEASAPVGAVFLSYASQDAEAAKRICEALSAAGIEVWFDQSELRGGEAWDQTIRQRIHDCQLFLPIISANTERRDEGYFRREWRLAVERAGDMAHKRPFLVPVVIDATPERGASVPEKFHELQWTRLTGGGTTLAFVERIQRLLSPGTQAVSRSPEGSGLALAKDRVTPVRGPNWPRLAVVAFVVLALAAYFLYERRLTPTRAVAPATPPGATAETGTAPFNPPPHSIAVLPFVNLSGDKEQEYFSDGLTEEMLNSLSQINELQVAARTSAFSFKGKEADIGTIAHKLNVAAVLEGSVRRSEHTVRVTAQLINAVTGFHLWSKTYDRDLGDVLKLQTEIASAVAEALKVTLLGDVAVKIELGGTRNPAALDAYLRGLKLTRIAEATSPMVCGGPVDAFSEAITLDSSFALAYANRALITWECAGNSPEWLAQPKETAVRADAARAIALAPNLAEGYVALSRLEQGLLKFKASDEACSRALALAPGNVQVLYECSLLAVYLGRTDTAISAARRGVALDPLNPLSHRALGDTLRYARRYPEAIAAYQAAIAADPDNSAEVLALRGLSYYLSGDLPLAQSSCEARADTFRSRVCRTLIYDRLGRHEDAARVLAQIVQQGGDAAAYQYVEIFTQWGDRKAALEWLEKASRLGDPGLVYTKVDPLLDPLRKEARFQAIERQLAFPD